MNDIEKKTLYLHIGMGKTGTTALQSFFWTNRELLAKNGILYPYLGMIEGAHHLLSPYHPSFLKEDCNFVDVDVWGPMLLNAVQPNILISSELMVWASEESVIQFCEKLKQLFQVKIVIYLRRQDNIIMASYNQVIKDGSQRENLNDSELEKLFLQFNYEQKLKPWRTALGKENIIVRPYEKGQFYEGDIIKDFMHYVLGLEFTNQYSVEKENQNPRLSTSAMEFKRLLNNLIFNTKDSDRFIRVLLDYSREEDSSSTEAFSSKSILPSHKRLELLRRSTKLNERIARDYLKRENGMLFYDPLPDVNEQSKVTQELTQAKIIDIAEFIVNKDPELMNYLFLTIHQGLISENAQIKNAAEKLQPILKLKKKDKGC